jgi:glutaryl-CoA dehydrogenase
MDLHYSIGEAPGTDYFGLREPFTAQQESYLVRTREFVAEVLPVIKSYWERVELPWPPIEKMSALGIVGDGIEGYGCPPMDPLSAGLVNMEISRGDGSLGTFPTVQAGLAMKAIAKCGSQEQEERLLGPIARLEKIGAFALTEPDHGSDSVSLETTARPGACAANAILSIRLGAFRALAHMGTLMPRLTSQTFAGQEVKYPMIMPICMRSQ